MEQQEGAWRAEGPAEGEDPRGPGDMEGSKHAYDEEESNRLVTEALQQEDEFLAYLMSLPVSGAERKRQPSAPTTPLVAAPASEEQAGGPPRMGLDHLDNLCKLMEQLGDLREQNSKLQRRVQYLEDLKSLQEMHKRLQDSLEYKRRALAGCLQESQAIQSSAAASWRGSLRRRRARSRSVGHEEGAVPGRGKTRRGASAKVSRWARVREAVKWEEARLEAAGPTPAAAAGGSPRWRVTESTCPLHEECCPLECPYHEYSYQLSSSSTSSESLVEVTGLQCGETGEGPHRSASATDSTADKLLLECSPLQPRRRRSLSPRPEEDASRRSKSLDCEDIQRALVAAADKAGAASKKAHSRTPWGKVKDIIQTRKESVRRREAWEWSDGPPGPRAASPHPQPEAPAARPASASPHQPRHEGRTRKEAVQGLGVVGAPPRPPSKWTKVKKAFLTSRKDGDGRPDPRMRLSYSECEPPATNHTTGIKRVAAGGQTVAQEAPSESESWSPGNTPSEGRAQRATNAAEVQKNYGDLQQTLSLEFHKKLSEWEKMKAAGGEWPDKRKRTADGDWPKAKACSPPDDSHMLDFRKKLSDWRGDGARPRGDASRQQGDAARQHGDAARPCGDAAPGPEHGLAAPQIRKRLAEWQLWRAGKSGQANVDDLHKMLPEEFCRKLGEWERIKWAGAGEARKDASALGRVVRRMRAGEVERRPRRPDPSMREPKHRGKEVQWLQKELQKVEREKVRLEREREKYLEREARLERMRRAMGQCPPGKQEVLIQTSTGFFRFQGISEKFTRKLYEWEKQRGIGPEASTFTLLDPAYIPLSPMGRNTATDDLNTSADAPQSTQPNILTYQQIVSLPRSRSEGSVADSNPTNGGLMHSRSSSLGHIDSKDASCLGEQEVPSRASSEPRLRSEVMGVEVVGDFEDEDEEETAALLVEVEDVVEETAAALEHLPKMQSQMPVYSYAPEEVTRLIDSSGSESEKDGKCSARVNRTSSVRTQSSYELIEENMALINKLKMKEDICRELENEIEDLEEKIQGIAKTHREELERLRMEETDHEEKSKEQLGMAEDANSCSGKEICPSHTDMVARLKSRVDELERCQEQLKQEEENLQVHSEQQAALAQNLVGKMKQLHEVSKSVGEQEDWGDGDVEKSMELSKELLEASLSGCSSMALIQNLSTELLQLAEKLEVALADRNQEIRTLRNELKDRQDESQKTSDGNKDVPTVKEPIQDMPSGDKAPQPSGEKTKPYEKYRKKTFAKAMIPRQSSEELAELPFLLTNKVLELKQELSRLCIPQEPAMTLSAKEHPSRGILQKTQNIQSSDEGTEEESATDTTVAPSEATKERVEESGHHLPALDEGPGVAASKGSSIAEGAASLEKASSTPLEDDIAKPSEIPLDVGRRKSSDCISTPPSERTRSPSVSSVEEWKESMTSWHEVTPGSSASGTKWAMALGSGEDKGESDETESKSDESEAASCLEAGKEECLKARRVSDTHVAYVGGARSAKPSFRGAKGSASSSTNGSHGTQESTPESEISRPSCASHAPTSSSPLRDPAPNVFVQTTRKIFSPICGEHKGNVISYVVGLPAESEVGNGIGRWQKSKVGTEKAPPSPRPASARRAQGTDQVASEGQTVEAQPCAHPLPPPMPSSSRRDKGKEAAPSIRLMIAKYDRKESGNGRSPESGGLTPGSRSPAWLSPTADRRELFAAGGVKAQMEKYQDEVRKALLGFSNPEVATVQKSASAGIIRSLGVGPNLKPPLHSIAKSSSAGAIKSAIQPKAPLLAPNPTPIFPPRPETEEVKDTTSPISESIERTLQVLRERLHSSPSPPQSQKFAHLRALRLRKAKEEFMTRNAATDDRVTSGSRFPSLSSVGTESSSVGLKGTDQGGAGHDGCEDGSIGGGSKGNPSEWAQGRVVSREQTNTSVRSRHSQISFGSESSYDDSIALQEGLTKSASSGMIDLYSQKCKQAPLAKVVEKEVGGNDGPSSDPKGKTVSIASETQSVPGPSKMGILSRFRKVKMRTKKMGAITALCRQSLLVNVHREGGGREERAGAAASQEMEPEAGPSKGKPVMSYPVPSCRSCPSSPVPSSKKAGNSGCWIHAPKHIFKPQKDCEENFPNAGISYPHKS
ncbi:uncharacterized protein LOC124171025 isoform X2 [Ischnura elegans]|uniref:uncharacterized protein LOC124171025 isoform X2 n=1 Tax=Ischnura elegans TaxID=197161 RepID=UPI001ED8848E|nr:uncharacterized protein LOC124171025 isoform X2 [Ischnura elegans]